MTYRLFVDSNTGIDVEPEYDFKHSAAKIGTNHRSRDASLFSYTWAQFDKIKFSVTFVNSSFKTTVNSWWAVDQKLLFMEVGGTEVSSVQLMNKGKPIDRLMKPYTDLFGGTIELEVW